MAAVSLNNMNNVVQNQLTRSLEKILEDANLSGELKLSGRKLKEFPKGKYNLSDTIFADLSKNRFCELPNDVTAFHFLERLLLYHNAIRNIPESVGALQSLAHLDLSRNHLTTLPREICLLPLEVLLVSNNRLVSLPDELGRMSQLSELDASCNFLAHLPVRIGELRRLRVLNLRSNALVYLPLEVVNLKLVSLNLSCNRISMLPVEMRLMDDLIELDISHNPLTVPPANLCEKGMVHIFKYLETQHSKNGGGGGSFKPQISMTTAANARLAGTHSAAATLCRNHQPPGARTLPHPASLDSLSKIKRPHVDSGYCTSEGGLDRHWLEDAQGPNSEALNQYQNLSSSLSSNSSQDTITPLSGAPLASSESRSGSSTPSTISPGPSEIHANRDLPDDRLANIQTYREYKEALRQQRQLDGHVVYRSKEHTPPTPQTPEASFQSSLLNQNNHQPPGDHKFISSSPSTPLSSRREYGHGIEFSNSLNHNQGMQQISKYMNGYTNGQTTAMGNSPIIPINPILNGNSAGVMQNRKPVQKVIPSRNIANDANNTNELNKKNSKIGDCDKTDAKDSPQSPYKGFNNKNDIYMKPNSPIKHATNILSHNSVPIGNRNGSMTKNGNRTVTWENNSPDKLEKFSFTMKREFDKQKEETELIEQLRNIIESRLKMTLPQDLGSALTDGVVLCHLANQVCPRAVATIHVPSATVPKLTMARCRRNVDNFLEACRKIGVEETLLPSRDHLIGANTTHSPTEQRDQTRNQPVDGDRTLDKATLSHLARLCVVLVRGTEERWVIESSDLEENMGYVMEQLENHAFVEEIEQVVDDVTPDARDTIDGPVTECRPSLIDNDIDAAAENDINTKIKIDRDGAGSAPKDLTLKDRIRYFETGNERTARGGNDVKVVSYKFQVPIEKDVYDCDKSTGKYMSSKLSYDRTKLALYLDNNLNANLKYDSLVHNRLVTVVCLSGFFLTVIILILFPLPD